VGQDKLGRAVEKAARVALARTARETGRRLKSGINAFYRERAAAENLPMTRGGLLDIERGVRALQFKLAADDPETFTPSPLKALDRLAAAGIITGDQRLTLHRAYSWQWFVANRISLLGVKSDLTGDGLRSKRLDEQIRRPGAAARTLKEMKAAKSALSQAARGGA
jgi:glutamine synthetase adenylyltransferase